MRIPVGSGTYVVAVSGGVDSMVLLDLLRKRPNLKLIVAHFDHGIREDSAEDRRLVQKVARQHQLPFIHDEGKLGSKTSEATARKARYDFLHRVKKAAGAKAIITAHHQDDKFETAILNMLRGTGRRGLSSLKSTDGIIRPLLDYSKEQLRDYAQTHSLLWREDPSNQDTTLTRNHIRHIIMPKFSLGQRAQLLILLDQIRETNDELDTHIINLLHSQPAIDKIERQWFISLPHDVSREIVHAWLRHRGAGKLDKKTIERLVVTMKTGKPGSRMDIDGAFFIEVKPPHLALLPRDR